VQKNSRSDWGHVAATTSGAVATKCLAIGLKRRSSIESIETDLGDLYADAKENRFLMEFLDAGLSDMREISRVVTDIKISTLEHSVWHISDLKRSMALEKAAAFCRTGTEPPKKNLKLFSATTAAIVPLKFLALGKQIEKKVAAVASVTGMPHPPP